MHKTPNDLIAELLPDGRFLARSRSFGVGAKLPAFAMAVLSHCRKEKTRLNVMEAMGPQAAAIYDQLVEVGLLVDSVTPQTEVMFNNFAGLSVHRRMLSDNVRLAGYKQAIERIVKPGDIVIDAGAGSGILSIYAAMAGAKKVYAIEGSELSDELHTTATNNGFSEVIVPIQGNFGEVKLPQKADVLITETFGSWALAEGAAEELKHCISENLKDGGHCVPEQIRLWAAPMAEIPKEMLAPFQDRWDDVDLSAHAKLARQRSYNTHIDKDKLSGPAQMMGLLGLTDNEISSSISIHAPCKGIALWFDLVFNNAPALETSPFALPTHWKQTCIAIDLPPGEYELTGKINPEDKRGLLLMINELEWTIR